MRRLVQVQLPVDVQEVEQLLRLFGLLRPRAGDVEVVSDDVLGLFDGVREPEQLLDLLLRLQAGSGRESDQIAALDSALDQEGQLQIRGSEAVGPLRHAVNLVDSDQLDAELI